jgi:hypothetical protein
MVNLVELHTNIVSSIINNLNFYSGVKCNYFDIDLFLVLGIILCYIIVSIQTTKVE